LSDRAPNDEPTLYRLLAVSAPASAAPGETLTTRQKETIDNDVETFSIDGGVDDEL
jgi:hypothetical protein